MIKKNKEVLKNFVQNVFNKIKGFVETVYQQYHKNKSRRTFMIDRLNDLLTKSANESGADAGGKIRWMSHVIMADIEEFF